MQLQDIEKRVAENIGSLTEGDTIASGRVSQTDIRNFINDVYRETPVFMYLSDKIPHQYKRKTQPFSTYTATGTASTSGTTLTATTDIFNNSMLEMYVENPTTGEKIKIESYTSETVVTLETAPTTAWSADTIYVLGDTFSFGGDTTDIKEVVKVEMKYSSTDTKWTELTREDEEDLARDGSESYSVNDPKWSQTSIVEEDGSGNLIRREAITLTPAPTSYLGKIRFTYIERPVALSTSTDEPILSVQGLSQVLVNGATYRALVIEERYEAAANYIEFHPRTRQKFPEGTLALVGYYKPKNRSGAKRLKLSPHFEGLRRGRY